MAFGKVTKEDLVAAGLDPDEIKNSLKAVKDGSATKEDMTNVTNALTAIQDSFKALEGKLNAQPEKKVEQKTEEEKPDPQTEFLTDPVAYVDKKTNNVVIAAAVEFKRMSRDLAWKELSRSLRGFNNSTIKAEIEEEWKKYPADRMAQTNTDPALCLQQIHDMILGKHHDEIVQDTNKKDGKFNLVHSGTGASSGNTGAVGSSGGQGGNKSELTIAEKNMAKKFGMTDEEWVKQGEDMEKEEEERKAGIFTGAGR